jgi:hypothetical protein
VFWGFEGVTARHLVRYDGHTFERVGDGMDGDDYPFMAEAMTNRGPALFIYGQMTQANGGNLNQAQEVLVLGCRPGNCAADCTGDGVLDVADFACFLQKYAAGDPYANCDGSGIAPGQVEVVPKFNVADFSCFIRRFAQGCP